MVVPYLCQAGCLWEVPNCASGAVVRPVRMNTRSCATTECMTLYIRLLVQCFYGVVGVVVWCAVLWCC